MNQKGIENYTLDIPDIGKFHRRPDGRWKEEINPQSAEADIAYYRQTAVKPQQLIFDNIIPFSGSGVIINQEATLILGSNYQAKSKIAKALGDQGFDVFADSTSYIKDWNEKAGCLPFVTSSDTHIWTSKGSQPLHVDKDKRKRGYPLRRIIQIHTDRRETKQMSLEHIKINTDALRLLEGCYAQRYLLNQIHKKGVIFQQSIKLLRKKIEIYRLKKQSWSHDPSDIAAVIVKHIHG